MPDTLPAEPHPVAADTWIIPTFGAAPGGTWVGAHSMVVRGAEPTIVDTGSSLVRDDWFAAVESVVDLDDVRWVFLSHDDHDHVGNVLEVMARCPQATLVGNFLMVGRLAADVPLPVERMRWLDPGDSFDAGDRTFHLVRPPMFDSPTTRGLFDTSTRILWAADSFGSLVPGAVFERGDVPDDLWSESFDLLNGWTFPWLEWVDRSRYSLHVDATRRLRPLAVASAHGPVLRGGQIDDAYARTMALAARPAAPMPGKADLDAIVAAALLGAPVSA